MSKSIWLTNDPDAAAILSKADKNYEKARATASQLPLADKINALRAAKITRDLAYKSAHYLKS